MKIQDNFFKINQILKQKHYKKGNNAISMKEKFLKKTPNLQVTITEKILLRKVKTYYKNRQKVLLRYLFILENYIFYNIIKIII